MDGSSHYWKFFRLRAPKSLKQNKNTYCSKSIICTSWGRDICALYYLKKYDAKDACWDNTQLRSKFSVFWKALSHEKQGGRSGPVSQAVWKCRKFLWAPWDNVILLSRYLYPWFSSHCPTTLCFFHSNISHYLKKQLLFARLEITKVVGH